MEYDLHQWWLNLTSKYTDDELLLNELWNEIHKKYTSKKRHYHNLNHIGYMLRLAADNQTDLIDYDTLQFAIWYHDVIYNALKSDNELKSAAFARKRLKKLKIDPKSIENCANLIISTKKHEILNVQNQDNAYLLDFDLAILGTTWKWYELYTKQIRKEYSMYPDFMYKKGRKKVLQHFLERPQIYYTEKYHNLWEANARKNIQKEISLL
ncbi:hypothetical protein H2O64_05770 [Kordia sp. YSTF-M3]|uniref:Metal-dependent HD superfamily phosphohydrolase n=1 Tax=Kordia aestuariivivens TaxID=2759037 RepID=A0ABR7Q6K3_9FLAO|nr:hypothetical protein [Kordia aestuariivivens]MBC8754170.1 hypothetical protein [Kordia aestuariivivens]